MNLDERIHALLQRVQILAARCDLQAPRADVEKGCGELSARLAETDTLTAQFSHTVNRVNLCEMQPEHR